MTSQQRVMTALDFGTPDRVPRFDEFWGEWVAKWRDEKPEYADIDPKDHYGIDVQIVVGDEAIAPSRAETLRETPQEVLRRDGWGRVVRTIPGGYFYEQVENALEDKRDLDKLHFDPPDMASRYQSYEAGMPALKERTCVFAKTGGPFIRTYFVRGEVNYLMDMVEDPSFAAELTMRIADHLIAVGLEELRRWDLYDTGVWIFDDMASAQSPMFSPRTADAILVPAWAKMVSAFKAAGARKVILHSDGNIGPLLDRFIDIGFDGINPVEPNAGLSVAALRRRYGHRLALLGGICNNQILPRGNREQIRQHTLEVLSAGREGGLVIGTHSIGPDVPVESYDYYHELIEEYGRYPMGW